jgi:pimeloyl-ACP methyl ester carboxylesterase
MQIIVDGLLTEYDDSGRGPTVLMLHGWRDRLQAFDGVAAALGSHYRVIRLDLPNFGASARDPRVTSLDDYGRFVAAFLKSLKVKQLDALVGHSLGGQIAVHAASRGTLMPKRLVLIAAAGIRDRGAVWKRSLRLASKPLRYIVPGSIKVRFYRAIGSDYSPRLDPLYKRILNGAVRHDIQAEAASLRIPTLLIWGSADESTPLAYGQAFHQLIKKSELRVIESASHHVEREHPEAVAKNIREFIR